MPRSAYRNRGGVLRYRTVSPKPGVYFHVAVTRKAGPRGGRTIAGQVRHRNPFTLDERMRGIEAALANPRTPRQLKESMREELRRLRSRR